MSSNHTTKQLRFTLLIIITIISSAMADSAKDKEECTKQLVGLATCLPYVGGEAKAPTPDCCSGLKQLLNNNKKCLCVIIKDGNDPDLSLQINVTIALGLPNVCHSPANVSKCPELLHLPPNSPEAQVFYQLGDNNSSALPATSPASGPSVDEGSPVGAKSEGTSSNSVVGPEKGEACCSGKRWAWLGLESVAIGSVFLWFF